MIKLSANTKKRLLILGLGLVFVSLLGLQFVKERGSHKVIAVGDLTFTFNGLPPTAPVFMVDDLKPGDCYIREVAAQNDGQYGANISTRADAVQNPDNLGSILFLTIKEGAATLYGGGGSKTLNQFFTESTATVDGLPLSVLAAGTATTYTFTVCMPPEAGNEWQRDQLIFDLLFGQINKVTPTVTPTLTPTPTPTTRPTPTPTPSIPVPEECQALAGKILNVFTGTQGPDKIHGTIYNDLIYGLGGDDELDSSGGDDCVIGGPGNDILDPEDGSDIVVGGAGNDKIKGGSGDEVIFGNEGADTITGGSGLDLIYGGDGPDSLNGGSGNDRVYGENGNDLLKGEAGDDLLDGGPGTDSTDGGSGTDTCPNSETKSSC